MANNKGKNKANTEVQNTQVEPQNQVTETQATQETVAPVKEQPKRKVKEQINLNELVACRNVHSGSLNYVSKATGGLVTRWGSYGDVQYLEFKELLSMKSTSRRFLEEPWLIVDDEEIAEHLGLTDLYSRMIPVDEIENFFTKPISEIEAILKKAPNGTRNLVKDKARELVEAEQLWDNRVIRLLERELLIDLQMVQD